MSMINVTNLTFAYDGSYDNIFENISFQIDTDWKLGFIGRNGRGKTTFLNLLLGKYEYSGSISSTVDFEYFPYPIADENEMTESIIESMLPNTESWQIFRELNLLDADPEILYRPYKTLSNGERIKVQLAALFLKENAFLLIDEPTNHLDAPSRKKISQYLNSKKGFILVSHDRAFLDECIDHVLSINKTTIEVQKGNFSSWYANKEAQDNMELTRNEHLKRDIRRLSTAARRTGNWSNQIEKSKIGFHVGDRGFVGHKAAKMMKRAKSLQTRQQAAIQEKSELLKDIESMDDLQLNLEKYHTDLLLSMKDMSITYSDKPVCSNISLEIRRGDRICLNGKNGCGKSSLIKLILGEEIPFTGDFHLGSGVKISYVAQDTSGMHGDLKTFALEAGISDTLFLTVLRKLGLERVQFEKNIEEFSEGQKKKVLLAKSLCEPAHLFIWDEPLNFIDIFSRIQIEELLLKFQPTLLFVEHDQVFQEHIATKTINF